MTNRANTRRNRRQPIRKIRTVIVLRQPKCGWLQDHQYFQCSCWHEECCDRADHETIHPADECECP